MRALLLDVDGVLVIPPEYFGARMMREHPDHFGSFFHGPFMAASRGETDLMAHLPPLLAATGRAQTALAFLAEWLEAENHPNLPLMDEVQQLRAEGWRTYLATNQETHRLNYLLEDMSLGQLVDGEFSSCTLGVRKPDAEYFERVQAELGLLPSQIVFWDDAPGNVEAALAVGWAAHLYIDVAGFRRVMAEVELV